MAFRSIPTVSELLDSPPLKKLLESASRSRGGFLFFFQLLLFGLAHGRLIWFAIDTNPIVGLGIFFFESIELSDQGSNVAAAATGLELSNLIAHAFNLGL